LEELSGVALERAAAEKTGLRRILPSTLALSLSVELAEQRLKKTVNVGLVRTGSQFDVDVRCIRE
jgi:hypothetical protein